jgi:transposase
LNPQAEIEKLKAELQAGNARIAVLENLVAQLRKQNEALVEQLTRHSRNSNRPPSSDPPGGPGRRGDKKSKKRDKPKKRRKRGGQVGHRGSHRTLLPAEKVTRVEDVFPSKCENCWQSMPETIDPDARRYQVMEIPPFEPEVTEYRRHAVTCECGHTTRVPFTESQIPTSAFGPRLMSLVGLFTGVYHLSRRKAEQLLSDVCGVEISLGALSALEARVSDAVAPAVAEAWEQVQAAEVKHTDGTSWLQSGAARSLWTLATGAATVFKIVVNSSRASLIHLYGEFKGILVSDRAKVLNFWAMERRQVCWAHLLRKFVSFSERDGPAGRFGRELLDYTGILFSYWHDFKDGRLDEKTFQAWMRPVREQLEATLERAVAAQIPRLSGSCADILAHREALWTFVSHPLVEPTNNHAERELRAFVLWRKRSFGTRSERGNLFAERMMTVAHTARKQGKDILEFLTACCAAREAGAPAPSLFESDIQAAS